MRAAGLFGRETEAMQTTRRALILSVGYGEGHHAAAGALQEELESRGWHCVVADGCKAANPVMFRWTQLFYQFCVRRMPWLWGVTYAQTETARWAKMLWLPGVARCKAYVAELIRSYKPDVIYCTYPLYAYMLDVYAAEGWLKAPYVLVVTDALEISRPWMQTRAPLVCVPDAESRRMVVERHGLHDDVVADTGFPVKKAFTPPAERILPRESDFRITYGAYAPTRRVCRDVRAILAGIPGADVTLIAGKREGQLRRLLYRECAGGRLKIIERTQQMACLFRRSHLYIGKAGAATMFEAYAAHLPMVVNYALPGQEQGNLQLLLQDKAGLYVESTAELIAALQVMLQDEARLWQQMRAAMHMSARGGAGKRIVDLVERRFSV